MPSWELFAFASAFFAGLTAIFSKVGVENIPSNLATLIRTAIILILLAVGVYWRGQWRSPEEWPSRTILFLVLSALTTGISWACYYKALQLGPASVVAPLDKLSLVIAVILSVIFLGERLNVLQWLGVAMMAMGAFLVAKL